MLPKKWGQGQLFAFSAVDGKSFFSSDFTGTLSGDKIGVIFHTKCRRTLFFTDAATRLNCVASDMILLENSSMIFAERHLVTGEI
ncbi:MAG: hypothetical protein U0K91_05405, partial [Acutalibacteraceae bacterium]|nr:hypothetical protein [Acutalibacteraceae bacterium]